MSIKCLKSKKLISMLMTMTMVTMLSFTAFASGGDGTGGGDPNSDLVLNGAYNTTINGSSATLGTQILGGGTIIHGTKSLEIYFNHNVSADYVKDSEQISANEVYNHNIDPTNLVLTDIDTSQTYTASRVGTGQTTDPEKQSLFFKDVTFVTGDHYTISVKGYHDSTTPGIRCYNGGYLSTGDKNVSFTATDN
jgi:hypothetical protein